MEEAELSYTAELSVSKPTFLDCYEVALFLHKQGIVSNVTTNITTQPNIEYGCKITQPVVKNKEIKTTWHLLKNHFGFNCAHLKIDGIYSGCILDYLRPSLCGKNIEN
jgi:hypothetical protein